jgi:cation diffusion facilitator CzcD-associated flavoprotein CzcO
VLSGGPHVHVAIVGGGFSGLGAAIRLKQTGVEDFVILERAGDLGGTWRDNSYPGCACDVPSHLYSFSFAPNARWSRAFSPQPEIWAYLRDCAERFNLLPHLRFGHEVHAARWADGWHIETSQGNLSADVLVLAVGPLSEPSVPDLPGLSSFTGTAFHSARWRHDHDLTGRRVAVVGTGASAAQFVPEIAPRVEALHVFQRTPPWVVPRRDRALTAVEQRLFRTVPATQRLARWSSYCAREALAVGFLHPRVMGGVQRIARWHLRRSVPDPALRDRLTPDYTLGCKRVVVSSDYLPALARDNVEVVTAPIDHVCPQGIVTADGVAREVDTIIFGTGFHVTDMPVADRVRGRDGRSLAEVWQGSPSAFLGTTVAGFPNLFLLLGPNTVLGHTSVVLMAEAQIAYLVRALAYMRRHGIGTVEPRAEAQARFVSTVDERMRGTVWLTGGCASWYLDRTGRNSALWPGYTWTYRRRLRRFDPSGYLLTEAA